VAVATIANACRQVRDMIATPYSVGEMAEISTIANACTNNEELNQGEFATSIFHLCFIA
jgi:hypothetical protein